MANSQYLIPSIEAARPLTKSPATLSLCFAGGEAGRVDLSEVIRGKRALTKLRDVETFRRAKPSDHGFGVAWPGGIEIGADTLYWLYRRQNGLWDAADELHTWRLTHGMALDRAADELGVSRRMLSYYEARKWPVPKTVLLALTGWDARNNLKAA